jgi:hypothetical protein
MPGDQSEFRPIRGPKHGKIIRAVVLGVQIVEFSYHALMRMKSRGVAEEDVLSTLRKPTQTGLPTEPGTMRVRWQKNLRTSIDVVYAVKADRIGIITAWTTKRSLFRPKRRPR